jgi:hypothetical protein
VEMPSANPSDDFQVSKLSENTTDTVDSIVFPTVSFLYMTKICLKFLNTNIISFHSSNIY